MDRLIALLRANPGLLAIVGIVVIATVVLSIIAIAMAKAGQSLRPIAFVAIFMAIILVPQGVWHSLVATGVVAAAPTYTWGESATRGEGAGAGASALERESAGLVARSGDVPLVVERGAFREPARVFGDGVDTTLIRRDAARIFGDALAQATHAEMAFLGATGETVLAASFASPMAAIAARDGWMRFFGVAPTGNEGSAVLVRRPTGDVAALATVGNALFAFTAADAERALRLAQRGGVVRIERGADDRVSAPVQSDLASRVDGDGSRRPLRVPTWAFVAWILVNLVVAVTWFFKGVAWAGARSADRAAAVAPASADSLRARLLAIGDGDVPYEVRAGPSPDEIEVRWKWADARWLDLARARRVTRTHKLVLRLDSAAHVVKVLEYATAFDGSVGLGGASMEWKLSRGVTFFAVEQVKGVGVALDARGRPTGGLTYEWRFDVSELKEPFARVVTSNGWEWRPALL